MNHARLRLTVAAIALGAVSLGQVGCAPARESAGMARQPVVFPANGSLPQMRLYGDFRHALPEFDSTPIIERFLYGPSDYGKTVLRNPQGMTLVGRRLLVCDQGYQRILAIDLDTGKSMFWSEGDRSPRCPVDLTHDTTGHVYVADTTSRVVLIYDLSGRFIENLSPPGNAHRPFRPCSICIRESVLYVGDLAARRIERYHLTDRRWLDPIAPPADQGPLEAPTGLGFTPDGTLLIVDAIQGRLLRRAADGKWLEPIASRGRGSGELIRPKQVCCTPEGLIFVSDVGRQSIQVYDADGRPITEIHEQANRWTGWTMPMGVLAVRTGDLPAFQLPHARENSPQPDSYVIVSDSLGPESLTLIGVVTGQLRMKSDGK